MVLEDYDEAERQANSALRLKPGDKTATELLSQVQNRKAKKQAFHAAMGAGHPALNRGEFDEAINQAQQALKLRPGDTTATGLLAEAEQAKYDKAELTARQALVRRDWTEAERLAEALMKLRPGDAAASDLLSKALKGKQDQVDYEKALTAAREALAKEDWTQAARRAEAAMQVRAGDTLAKELLSKAQEGRRKSVAYSSAMEAAHGALSDKRWEEAEQQAKAASDLCPEALTPRELLSQAQLGRRNAASHSDAIAAAQKALADKKWGEAEQQAVAALQAQADDAAAKDLLRLARKGKQDEVACEHAIAASRAAMDSRDYDEAERQAKQALDLSPGNPAAQQLLSQVQDLRFKEETVTVDEQPTSPPDDDAISQEGVTGPTRPANLDEIERVIQEADQRPRKRHLLPAVWLVVVIVAILGVASGLYFSLMGRNRKEVEPAKLTAISQKVEVKAGEPKPIILTGTGDSRATLIYTVASQPDQGTLSGQPPSLTYTARQNASGTDSFTFKVNDGTNDSPAATVSITIHTQPTNSTRFYRVQER